MGFLSRYKANHSDWAMTTSTDSYLKIVNVKSILDLLDNENSIATQSDQGLMSTTDKKRLDNVNLTLTIGVDGDYSTAQFLQWLYDQGAFDTPRWVAKMSWYYAGNPTIVDTGVGNVELAGALIELFTVAKPTNPPIYANDAAYAIRITTAPTSSPDTGYDATQFLYVNHGTGYAPKWRRLIDNVTRYTHPTGDGNWHVPTTVGATVGHVLKVTAAGNIGWAVDNDTMYDFSKIDYIYDFIVNSQNVPSDWGTSHTITISQELALVGGHWYYFHCYVGGGGGGGRSFWNNGGNGGQGGYCSSFFYAPNGMSANLNVGIGGWVGHSNTINDSSNGGDGGDGGDTSVIINANNFYIVAYGGKGGEGGSGSMTGNAGSAGMPGGNNLLPSLGGGENGGTGAGHFSNGLFIDIATIGSHGKIVYYEI
jgi:hypothetical protein